MYNLNISTVKNKQVLKRHKKNNLNIIELFNETFSFKYVFYKEIKIEIKLLFSFFMGFYRFFQTSWNVTENRIRVTY